MHKYIMKDSQDYRPGTNPEKEHGVLLIVRGLDGIETAFGEFATVDADMQKCTQAEEDGVLLSIKI